MQIDAKKVALRLHRLMKAMNMTQKQLADNLGITQPAVSKYLQGRIPPADVLLHISSLAETSMEWILTGITESPAGKVSEPPQDYNSYSAVMAKLERLPVQLRKDMEQLLDSLCQYF